MKSILLGVACVLGATSAQAAESWCMREEVNRTSTSSIVNGQARVVQLTTERETCVSLPVPAAALALKDLAYLGISATKIVDPARLAGIGIGTGGRIDGGLLAGIGIGTGGRIEPRLLDSFLQLLAGLQARVDPGVLPLMAMGGKLEVSVRYLSRLETL